MRRILVGAALGVAMGLLVSTAEAGGRTSKDAAPRKSAAKTTKKVKPFFLHGVRWYRGLEASRSDRKAAKRPVLWMRVLGDPTGDT